MSSDYSKVTSVITAQCRSAVLAVVFIVICFAYCILHRICMDNINLHRNIIDVVHEYANADNFTRC